MGQFKTLERLHHQLHCYGRLGFWSDGDEVFDNVCRYGPTHRKDYIYQCISDFEKELTWLPDSIKETRLEAILSTLATFWNEAREYNMDTGEGYDCEQSFITT